LSAEALRGGFFKKGAPPKRFLGENPPLGGGPFFSQQLGGTPLWGALPPLGGSKKFPRGG